MLTDQPREKDMTKIIQAFLTIILAVCATGCGETKKEAVAGEAQADKPTVSIMIDGKAPAAFAVKLSTTAGDIVIDVTRDWSPNGADRFLELVEMGYYKDVAFFRVIEGFMAQVGIHGDPAMNKKWKSNRIQDDSVEKSNTRGMLSFATSGRNSRTTQFFISLGDNSNLDGMGFSPFGRVRDMAAVDKLYAGYGEGAPKGMGPSQRRVHQEGNAYLKKEFPRLDYVKSASVVVE